MALLGYCFPGGIGICNLGFHCGRKTQNPGKSLRARMRTDDKLNIHVTMVAELNPDHNGGR